MPEEADDLAEIVLLALGNVPVDSEVTDWAPDISARVIFK
jgi:hypothetical protein